MASPTDPHIILVGLPGAGKSTCGARLAEVLSRPFVDLDAEIEHSAGAPISSIFAKHGEEHFRDLESNETRRLLTRPPSVVSPGGGWVERRENQDMVRSVSVVVWLRVSPAEAARRMGAQTSLRPLLAGGDPESRIARLLERRERFYEASDVTLDTEVLGTEAVVSAVRELVWQRVGSLG